MSNRLKYGSEHRGEIWADVMDLFQKAKAKVKQKTDVCPHSGNSLVLTHLLFSKAWVPKRPNHTEKKQHVKVPRCTASIRHRIDRCQAISLLFTYRKNDLAAEGAAWSRQKHLLSAGKSMRCPHLPLCWNTNPSWQCFLGVIRMTPRASQWIPGLLGCVSVLSWICA